MNLRLLGTTAGLALAMSALVVPAPAQAAALTSATNFVQRQVNETGPASCNVTNSGSNSSSPFTSNGVTNTQTVSGTTTLVDAGDAGDTSSIDTSATSRMRATEAGGSLRTITMDASFSAKLTIAQGIATDCDANIQLSGQSQMTGVLTKPKWVVVDAEVPLGATAQVIFQRTAPASPQVVQILALIGTSKGRAHGELYLPAGTYQHTVVVTEQWNGPTAAGDPTTFASAPFVHEDFQQVGIAKGAASGTGTQYLKLKNNRKCAGGKLTGKFTSAAGVAASAKIKKAIFKVNGAKAKVVNLPEKNDKVTLTGLASDQDISVKAVLKLFGGGSATVTRDYRSCT